VPRRQIPALSRSTVLGGSPPSYPAVHGRPLDERERSDLAIFIRWVMAQIEKGMGNDSHRR
jgi:hypothetical protein